MKKEEKELFIPVGSKRKTHRKTSLQGETNNNDENGNEKIQTIIHTPMV